MRVADPPLSGAGDGWLIAGLLVIFVGVVAALGGLARHEGTAGRTSSAPARWPAESSLPRRRGRASLLLFTHPGCPCTSATLHELARVTDRFGDRVDVTIVVAAIAGVTPAPVPFAHVEDRDAREATRFGALTSGQVVLYDADGALLYAGGITLVRGHEGDNAGLDHVLEALSSHTAQPSSPVFGCALREDAP